MTENKIDDKWNTFLLDETREKEKMKRSLGVCVCVYETRANGRCNVKRHHKIEQ